MSASIESTASEIAERVLTDRGVDGARELVTMFIIARSIKLTGAMTSTGAEADFVCRAYEDLGDRFASGFRAYGLLMTHNALRAAGMRANVKFSAGLYDLLNDQGRENPIEAAGTIVRTILHTNSVAKSLGRFGNAERDMDHPFSQRLFPSNAAAGPCDVARNRVGQVVNPADAELLPLGECDRPGQCVCRYVLA